MDKNYATAAQYTDRRQSLRVWGARFPLAQVDCRCLRPVAGRKNAAPAKAGRWLPLYATAAWKDTHGWNMRNNLVPDVIQMAKSSETTVASDKCGAGIESGRWHHFVGREVFSRYLVLFEMQLFTEPLAIPLAPTAAVAAPGTKLV